MPKYDIKPLVKWVGGKRQLLNEINKLIPENINCYFEPFVGGGAVFFSLQPAKAVINDNNPELVNMYKTIRSNPKEIINLLKSHKNEKDYFYELRDMDRTEDYANFDSVFRASRLIFLNKTCYNGLYRVNGKGQFNTPFGKYKNPNIVDEDNILNVSKFLNEIDLEINYGDYYSAVQTAVAGDFVYFDPPYDPISSTSSFTSYTVNGFGKQDQIELRNLCDFLDSRGVRFLLSNSATDFVKDLYQKYDIKIVKARRAVSSNTSSREPIDEVLVKNY